MEGLFSCPECGYENPKGSTACQRCLLVFDKHERKLHKLNHVIGASSRLEGMWRDILVHYNDFEQHEKFIQGALVENNLSFASQQYRKMAEANPLDEIAPKMLARIIQMATLAYVPLEHKRRPVSVSHMGAKVFILIVFILLIVVLSHIFLR